MPFEGKRNDPYRGYKFRVEIDGFESAGFSKVSGLKSATEITEYREGTDEATPHKLPGLTTYENITLERGVSIDKDFQTWRAQVKEARDGDGSSAEGVPTPEFRKDIAIQLYDKGGEKVKEWEIYDAWPAEDEIDDLDAASSDVLIGRLVLAHEGAKQVV